MKMTHKLSYNKKIVLLSAVVAALAIVYILTFVLDQGNRRSRAFAWLDSSFFDMADRIEIYGINGNMELVRRNNVWFLSTGMDNPKDSPTEYPAKQGRVEDLFAALSRKDAYPLRATSREARQRLGLTEDSASRIIVRGGAGLPLLDLLIGKAVAVGSEIYLRREGWNEIYSGEDHFTLFTDSSPDSWYDLRLFSNIESGRPLYSIDDVQQANIRPSDGAAITLRRSGAGWIIQGNESAVDNTKVDAWLRSVLEAEGEDFANANLADANFGDSDSITLWFGDGTSRSIQVSISDDQDYRKITVSGSLYTYIIGERIYNNLFRGSTYFLRQ
jgi:hypothetical protein